MSDVPHHQPEESFDDVQFETEESELADQKKGDKTKQLREELKAAKAEAKEHLDGWQRARADYVNLQKSLDTERGLIRKRAVENLIIDLLPTLDNFESAMKNKEVWEKVDQNWRTGIEYINQQLRRTLEDYGISEIPASGMIDHQIHEPLETIETDDKNKDGEIAEIVQKGYQMDGRVVRPTKVRVYHFKK